MSEIKASGASGSASARSRAFKLLSPAGVVWYRNKAFWRTTVISFIVGTVFMCASWAGWQFLEAKRQNDIASRQVLLDAVIHENTLRRWFEAASQILRIAAQNTSIRNFDQDPDAAIEQLRVIANEADRFSQLRILGNDGFEQIRLDRKLNGLEVAPADILQDKSSRYYFSATAELASGDVYISPIDLNVERGVIETPWRPTARLATPISTVDGDRRGYIVFNLDMAVPLAEFGRDEDHATRTELLNKDGYWLAGVGNDNLWAFMTEATANMALDQDALWQKVIRNVGADDVFKHGQRFYHARLITPVALAGLRQVDMAEDGYGQLFILASAPENNRFLDPRLSDIAVLLVGTILIAALSFVIGIFNLHRQQSQAAQERIASHLVGMRRMASLGRIVAGVTHEMRTPIGNAITVTSTLGEHLDDLSTKLGGQEIDPQSVRDDVSYLQNGVRIVQKNLERTVTLVGHFRQTAADQSNHNLREFDLCQLLGDLVATLRNQLKKSGIKIVFEGPEDARIEHYSDAIDQVVLSLITNAERHAFVDRSDAKITLRLVDIDAHFYQIDVEDNGVGIDPALHDRVFEPFWTANAANPGSGLGMAIVGNVVETVLGGSIQMQSVVGEGTIFSIILPKTVRKAANGRKSAFDVSGDNEDDGA
ncbi:ATP-binding protein [Thalassospira sp.]|uniref:sensor histidine kinase n=1 Tax=Thalassospira sp. TaxID=1912094 RepID=UPI0032ED153B